MNPKVLTPETATNETSLEQAVKTAIENAPSRVALEAEKEKLARIDTARAIAIREINRLVEELAKSRKGQGNSPESKIKKILEAGGDVSDAMRKIATKIGEAQGNLAAIDEVLRGQQGKVRALQTQFSQEVNRAIRTSRAPSVKRIAGALVELKAACDAEIEARSAITGVGVDVHALDNFGYLPVLGEEAWFDARRKQGFEV